MYDYGINDRIKAVERKREVGTATNPLPPVPS